MPAVSPHAQPASTMTLHTLWGIASVYAFVQHAILHSLLQRWTSELVLPLPVQSEIVLRSILDTRQSVAQKVPGTLQDEWRHGVSEESLHGGQWPGMIT